VRGILALLGEATPPPRELPHAGQGEFDPMILQAPDQDFD
jgi:hypothetical protein